MLNFYAMNIVWSPSKLEANSIWNSRKFSLNQNLLPGYKPPNICKLAAETKDF